MFRPLVAFFLLAGAAMAQEHRHPGAAALSPETGRFYESWKMPGVMPRYTSCCNQQDCAAVEHVRYWNGELQMQRKSDGRWLTIPPAKLESNFDDARDSPDGSSHMCSVGANVYCAVLGSGG